MTKRAPKPTSVREPPALFRQQVTFLSPGDLKGNQWRQLVGQAPVVRACVQTLVNQLTDLGWYLEGEDDEAVAYFTKVLEAADNSAGFETMLSRVVEDALVVPFGGAVEFGLFPDDVVAWVQHIDGATMVPTYSQQFPYVQADPFGTLTKPVPFRQEQIGRVRWQAETNIRAYGWTKTPAADCLPAIQGLLRADRFWQSFLLDSPPAGILDLMDFSEGEASEWYESWRTMLAGIDPFKVPILYSGGAERKQAAKFIEFHKSPGEVSMKELVKAYAEEVCACFGMSLADLGLFGQEMRLAGATKMMDLSKRQGLAKLKRGVKSMIDMDVLPDGVELKWEEMDLEDSLRKAQAKQITGKKIVDLVAGRVLSERQGLKVAIYEEVIPPDVVNEKDWEESEEPSEEDVEITDEEMGSEEEPTGTGVRDDLEERASAPPRAFPANSKPAREMGKVAQRMMAPARRGLTKKRLAALLDIGIKAFEKRSGDKARTKDDALAAVEKALGKADWWKSPNLTDDVARILNGAYAEGLGEVITEIETARVGLGLKAADVSVTSLNVTNKAVLKLLRERAGEFIKHIDDGTIRYIVQSIMRGVREGISSPEIARGILAGNVRDDLLETFKGRTASIVNTEINWAESQAALDEQRELGLAKKRWRTVRGLACEICKRNEDQGSVKADYEYESVFGSTQTTPGHPGVCHCWITFDKKELKGLGDDPGYWMGD